MPEETERVPQVSDKNTKKDILSAYQQVVLQLREKRKPEVKPEEKVIEKKMKNTVKTADELSLEGLNRSVNQVKTEFNSTLNGIMEKLEAELIRYQDVKQAVDIQEKELKEIYEIQKNASTLADLLELQENQKAGFENEMQQRRAQWQAERNKTEAEIREYQIQIEKERKREKEEYEYTIKREQSLLHDEMADKRKVLEKEMADYKETTEKALNEREKQLVERESRIESLENQIKILESSRDQALEEAIQNNTDKLQMDFTSRESLMKMEFEGQINVFKAKIQSLEDVVKKQNLQIDALTRQVKTSSEQVQSIALSAVEGSSLSKLNQGVESIRRSSEGMDNKEAKDKV